MCGADPERLTPDGRGVASVQTKRWLIAGLVAVAVVVVVLVIVYRGGGGGGGGGSGY
jgi:hypothetical protein